MKLAELVSELDAYFRVPDVRADDWSKSFAHAYPEPYWREYVVPGWEGRWNVTGNAATNCRLDFVQEEVCAFRERADAAGVALIDAMHYGMEKPPQLAMARWFGSAAWTPSLCLTGRSS